MTDILNDILFMHMLHLVYVITRIFGVEMCRYQEGSSRKLSLSKRLITKVVVIKRARPSLGRRGFKSRIRPPYPQRVVKGD